MSLDFSQRRAVLDAARKMAGGKVIKTSSRSFWKAYGYPPPNVRANILDRANAIVNAGFAASEGSMSGPIENLFNETEYGPETGQGGPADTDRANVNVTFWFTDDEGKIVYRSWRGMFNWSDDLSDVLAQMESDIGDMEGGYGIERGDSGSVMGNIVPGSVIIY